MLFKRKICSPEKYFKLFPEVKDLFLNGTEPPTQRPKDHDKQKDFYSGEKKHTSKNFVFNDQNNKVLVLAPTIKRTLSRLHDV